MKWPCKQVLGLLAVLVIVLACVYSHLGCVHRFISGFWVAGDSYLQESGLASMYLYIEPLPLSAWTRLTGRCTSDACIFMTTEDEIICNQSARVRFSGGVNVTGKCAYEGRCDIEYDSPEDTPLPDSMRFTVNPAMGTLAFHDDEMLRAYLHKDAVATEAVLAETEY
jgi:hypothetical protein